MTSSLLPDLVLSALLLVMAWGAMYAPARASAMSLFIAFGVVMALIWARLGAPDLALAEAAIGAGLTGTLLIQAASRAPSQQQTTLPMTSFVVALVFVAAASVWFLAYLMSAEGYSLIVEPDLASDYRMVPDLPQRVAETLPDSGVSYSVTAVLLNFRSWDTLLELMVLLLALIGVRQLAPTPTIYRTDRQALPTTPPAAPPTSADTWPLLRVWAKMLAPALLITGSYLLWRGAEAPGGAFQAGALLAAAAVMLRLAGLIPPLRWSRLWLRLAILAGGLSFFSVAVLTAVAGDGWLHYPQALAKSLILFIEIVATLSIAVTLGLLVIGEREDLRR